MNWTAPAYSRTKVDRAGEMLANAAPEIPALREALLVISNWRSSHSFPLNTLQMSLRDKAALVEDRRVIAQRLKRLSSIQLKLRRFPTMTLSQMQDIGGCRAILSSVPRVRELVRIFGDAGFKHALARKDDYITTPKASGYRSVHLIYRYHSDRNATYNGLQIEMQLRSQLQHAWATAVETVGTFLDQALKSSFGSARWLRFFTVMGSAIAHRERSPLVPGTPQSRGALARELRELGRELRARETLKSYGDALRTLEDPTAKGSRYFILALEPSESRLTIGGYATAELERATEDYLKAEQHLKGSPGASVVLVSVESLASLRRAYPNYFLDTDVFFRAFDEAIA